MAIFLKLRSHSWTSKISHYKQSGSAIVHLNYQSTNKTADFIHKKQKHFIYKRRADKSIAPLVHEKNIPLKISLNTMCTI